MTNQRNDLPSPYRVGVRLIDEQHKDLFSLLDLLREATSDGRHDGSTALILDRLLDYFTRHFIVEEELMRIYCYSGLAAHAAEHAAMRASVLSLRRDLAERPVEAREVLLADLERWVRDHIAVVDRELGRFLSNPSTNDVARA